jgi:hypothetical protein
MILPPGRTTGTEEAAITDGKTLVVTTPSVPAQ